MSSDAIRSVIDDDLATLNVTANTQSSYSNDALLITNYLDDYIVKGDVYNISLALSFTADVAQYFTSEALAPDDFNAIFLLPIEINPTSGFLIFNIYEDTEYTGGSAVPQINRNRNYPDDSQITVLYPATGTTEGDLIGSLVYGSAASGGFFGGSSGGGSGSSTNALILDKSKRYLFELTNSETATVGIQAEFVAI